MIDGIRLSEYIIVKDKKFGYAKYTCDVYVRKDIPETVTQNDVADFIDGYSGNFGYKMDRVESKGNYIKYKMTIYID